LASVTTSGTTVGARTDEASQWPARRCALDLVEVQQRAGVVAGLPGGLEEAGRRDDDDRLSMTGSRTTLAVRSSTAARSPSTSP
jgi:hypothetical protein